MSFKGATEILVHSFEIPQWESSWFILVEPVGELNAPISHRLWLAGVEALSNPMVEADRPSKPLN